MKKATLWAGFTGLVLLSNNTVRNESNGEIYEANKKGLIKIPATEAAEGIEAGVLYDFKIKDIIAAIGEEDWTDDVDSVEKTEAEKEAEAKAVRIKELNAEKKQIQKDVFVKGTPAEKVLELQARMEAIETELASLKPAKAAKAAKAAAAPKEFTAEEKAKIEEFESLLTQKNEAEKAFEAISETVKNFVTPEGYSRPDKERARRSEKMTYETAQEIRKAVAEKMSKRDVMEKFEISAQSYHYITTYLQHRLKTGDVAYLPLVNEYYPAIDDVNNDLGTDGAPLAESGIKEHDKNKYIIAATRKARGISAKKA